MNAEAFEKRLLEMEQRLDREVKELKESVLAERRQSDEWREQLNIAQRAKEDLQNQAIALAKAVENAQDALQGYEDFRKALTAVIVKIGGPVDAETVRMWMKQEVKDYLGPGEGAEVDLEHVKKVIKVKKVMKHLPTIDTTTPKGKVLGLMAEGFFDAPKFMSQIQKAIPNLLGIRIDEATKLLIEEGFMLRGKAPDRRNTFQKDPDVLIEMVV